MHPVKKNKENFPLRFEWEDAVKKFEDRKRGERIVSGNASPAEIKEAKKEAEEKTRYQKEFACNALLKLVVAESIS